MKKVIMAFFFCLLFSVSVQAKDVLPTNKTTASEGCTFVGVEGEYITDAQNALKRINEIRYEACEEGVWKMDIYGKPTTEKLTLSDYKPIKWSSALEYIARIRAAEATVVLAHERPNNENFFTSTLTSNGQKSYSENLAWNGGKSMLSGIEQWYKEKSDWVNKTGKTTGHYTSMINPDYNYVAVATFYNPDAAYKNATSAEFSHKKGLDETMNEMAGECIQTLEVKDSYLSLKLPVNNTSIKAGENTQAQANAVITNPSAIMHGETCEASLIGDITWTSSNKQVATVDKDGKITGIDYGTATITAKSGTLSQTIMVNVTTHVWDTGKVTTPPKCEATKTEEIAATGHQHTEIRDAKEAECETAGYTGDTYCTDCDKKLKDGKEIEATGHQNTEVRNAKEATCKETGYTGDTYCLKCEKKISTGTEIAKKPHTWNAGKVTTAPQCEKEGVKTYICTKCGATKTEAVEATGHQHTEIRNAKEAECETTGYTGDTYCTDCNKKLKEGVVIELTGHQNIEVRDAVEATCKKAGYTGDIYCLKCGKQISTGIEIPAKAHSWGTGKITKPASYTKTGIKTYTCKICGTKRTEAINKIPMPRVGTVYTIAGNQYRITKAGAEVSLIKTNAKAKNINIPATIKANGITYKVTTIVAKAFKQNKKLQSVIVGANVKSISNNAFFKCLSLKTVNLKTVLLTSKTASKKAFKGANKKLVIKVPKKVKKSYKKIFKGLKVK